MATLIMGVILGLCWSVRIRFLIAESAFGVPGSVTRRQDGSDGA